MINTKAFLKGLILVMLLAGCTQEIATPLVQITISSKMPTGMPTASSPVVPQTNLKPVDLQVGSRQVSLTLIQNDTVVPLIVQDSKHAIATLAPDTFTIRLEGNKEATYIAGQVDTLLCTLESYARPFATFDAGYSVFEKNNLLIFDPPLDFSADLGSFFAESWGGAERSRQIVNDLKGTFGTEPIMIYGGFVQIDPLSEESGYTIRTIKGVKPTDGETLFVTIFLRDSIVGEFDQLAWFTFHISFVAQ